MKRKVIQAFIVSLLICSMSVTPALGASLEDLQEDKAKAESEAGSLQAQLEETLSKIDTLETDIAKKKEDVVQAGDELEVAAAKQDEQNRAMRIRIKYMYEQGDSSFLEALLSSKSIAELLNKAEYITEVHAYDRNKLNEYIETTKKVKEMKESLQNEYEEMHDMQTKLEEEKADLSATLDSKRSEIALLDQSIQTAIAERQEAERRAREEEARRAEEERQRQEQAAREQEEDPEPEEEDTTPEQEDQQPEEEEDEPQYQDDDEQDSGDSDDSGSGYVPPQGSDGWAVVEFARQFIGNPYVWGGNSLTNGCDCSGFTQQIYAHFGISLPRTDSDQASCGVEIPLSQAQAGDLLCYYGHVGIYNGSGGIIHASAPGVGIVEWSSCQYRTLWCVRRIL